MLNEPVMCLLSFASTKERSNGRGMKDIVWIMRYFGDFQKGISKSGGCDLRTTVKLECVADILK